MGLALQEKHDFGREGRYGRYFHCLYVMDRAMECRSIAILLPHCLWILFLVARMGLAKENPTDSIFVGIMLTIFL